MTKDTKFHFVIQKHHATSLHYDFRLQIGSTMPSWAIPRGPTLNPKEKRLAMQVDDHALDYQNFEGVIPEGQYGAGPVMIWDKGIYTAEVEIAKGERKLIKDPKEAEEVMQHGLEKGQLKFTLHGKKLQGSFALVKINFGPKNGWLMIKHKDDFVKDSYNANDYDFSAVSNKSIEEIRNSSE